MVFRGRSTLSTRRDLIVLMSLPLLLPLEFGPGTTRGNKSEIQERRDEQMEQSIARGLLRNPLGWLGKRWGGGGVMSSKLDVS